MMPEPKPILEKLKKACRCPSCGCKCDAMPEGSAVCFACVIEEKRKNGNTTYDSGNAVHDTNLTNSQTRQP